MYFPPCLLLSNVSPLKFNGKELLCILLIATSYPYSIFFALLLILNRRHTHPVYSFRIMVPQTSKINVRTKVPIFSLLSWFNTFYLSDAEASDIQPHTPNVSSSFLPFFMIFWFYLVLLFHSNHVLPVFMFFHQVYN